MTSKKNKTSFLNWFQLTLSNFSKAITASYEQNDFSTNEKRKLSKLSKDGKPMVQKKFENNSISNKTEHLKNLNQEMFTLPNAELMSLKVSNSPKVNSSNSSKENFSNKELSSEKNYPITFENQKQIEHSTWTKSAHKKEKSQFPSLSLGLSSANPPTIIGAGLAE